MSAVVDSSGILRYALGSGRVVLTIYHDYSVMVVFPDKPQVFCVDAQQVRKHLTGVDKAQVVRQFANDGWK